MASKRKTTKKALPAVKKAVQRSKKAEPVSVVVPEAAPAAKPVNSTVITAIAAVVLVFVAVEIFFTLKMQVSINKRPALIASWNPEYKGQIGMPVYNDHLYVIDNNLNQIKQYSKIDGKLLIVYELQAVPKWVVETSTGATLIAVQNSPDLLKYEGKKLAGKVSLKEVKDLGCIAIDSKDDLFVSDNATGKIIKYGPDGVKTGEFGGLGGGNNQFLQIGRIFRDTKDNIYAIDAGALKVKIFSPKGDFIRDFKLKLKKLSGLEALAITPDGNIYINDLADSMIYVYSQTGKVIGKFDRDLGNRYKIGSPGAFSGGVDGNLYVGSYSLAVFQAIKY
jgi:hypothetical protein